MSILTDRQIKNLASNQPAHFIVWHDNQTNQDGPEELICYPLTASEEADVSQATWTWRKEDIDNIRYFPRIPSLTERAGELEKRQPMISPFVAKQVRQSDDGRKIISYGLSSAGYDVRLSDQFKIFSNINSALIDPKNFDEKCLVDGTLITDETGSYVILPPNSYLLGRTEEYFVIPKDILVIALGKSTYARTGAIVNVTPIEPEFEGNVVIEISNSTPLPMKVYANEGISQFIFLKSTEDVNVSYKDRDGKYQGQTGITLPKV